MSEKIRFSRELHLLHEAALARVMRALFLFGQWPAHLLLSLAQIKVDALAHDLQIDLVPIAELGREALPFQRFEQRVKDAVPSLLDRGKLVVGWAPPGIKPRVFAPASLFGNPAGNNAVRS